MSEVQVRSRGRAGWQEAETARLFSAVKEANQSGAPLRSVFESLSGDLGRKPNSIRNYYYACLRQQPEGALRAAPFTAFTPEETHALLRRILIARGEGKSVRSCVMEMAGGSHSRMLRYQNKYRAIMRTRPDLMESVRQELEREGLPCPEATAVESADSAFCDPEDAAAARLMAQPCVAHMLEGMKELLRRAARAEERADLQRTIDRMQVQQDLRRLAWEREYDEAAACLSTLAGMMKDFLELPKEEQLQQMDSFKDAAMEEIQRAQTLIAREN